MGLLLLNLDFCFVLGEKLVIIFEFNIPFLVPLEKLMGSHPILKVVHKLDFLLLLLSFLVVEHRHLVHHLEFAGLLNFVALC